MQAAVTAADSSVLQALGELITFLICASLSCSGRTTYIGPAQPEQLSFRGELVCHVQHVRWHVPMSLVVEGTRAQFEPDGLEAGLSKVPRHGWRLSVHAEVFFR